MSTARERAATRDYWNRPHIVRMARAWDYTKAFGITAAVLVAGSLNF